MAAFLVNKKQCPIPSPTQLIGHLGSGPPTFQVWIEIQDRKPTPIIVEFCTSMSASWSNAFPEQIVLHFCNSSVWRPLIGPLVSVNLVTEWI
jgi:hypothetical protein